MNTNNPMTREQLDAIRERVGAVGPIQPARYGTAPYEVYDFTEYEDGDMGGYVTLGSPREADAEFITHAYTDVPALLAEVERLRALTTVDDDMVGRAARAFYEYPTPGVDVSLTPGWDRLTATSPDIATAYHNRIRAALEAAHNPGMWS